MLHSAHMVKVAARRTGTRNVRYAVVYDATRLLPFAARDDAVPLRVLRARPYGVSVSRRGPCARLSVVRSAACCAP